MEILYLLIPLAIVLMVVALAFFLWTVKTGQYDDLEGEGYRILMDEDDPLIPGNAAKKASSGEKDQAGATGSEADSDK